MHKKVKLNLAECKALFYVTATKTKDPLAGQCNAGETRFTPRLDDIVSHAEKGAVGEICRCRS